MRLRLFLCLALALAGLAQTKDPVKDRDLRYEPAKPANKAAPVTVPRGYALVIGVSDYKNLDTKRDLEFAESDARSVARVLISKEAGNIEPENMRTLIGPAATIANIREAMEIWLPSVAKESDRVIVYFVGHGYVDPSGRGYLAPYDLDLDKLTDTAYPMDRLGEVLAKNVKARWKVLLTDACHSGKISPATTDEAVNSALSRLPKNFLTLTSSRESQRSFEDAALAGGFGLFSYFLVQGWEGHADAEPRDGLITADELITYVQREVRMYARQRNVLQNPTERGDFDDNLILGYSPTRRMAQTSAAVELPAGGLVIEVNLDGVEIFVDEQRVGVASRAAPLSVPGISSGTHIIKASRAGYETVTKEVLVYPGSQLTVTMRVVTPRNVKPEAKAAFDEGLAIWTRSGGKPADLKKAADLFEKSLSLQSDYPEAALGLCRIEQNRLRTDAAVSACRKAVQIAPEYVEARSMLGALYMEQGDYAEAVRQLSLAAQQSPKDPYVQSLLSEALFWTDRFEPAEEAATRSIQLAEGHAQGYLFRAEARRMQGKLDSAVEDYQSYLRSVPFESGAVRKTLFFVVGTGMRKHRAGRRPLYEAQRISALFGLCAAERGRNNYIRAIQHCKRALQLEADSDTHVLLGEVYAALFNEDNRREYLTSAKESYERALKLNPHLDKEAHVRRQVLEISELLAVIR